ncbi:MAG: hypothetical protein V4719_08015, partial [Planctomycetota bacterium]
QATSAPEFFDIEFPKARVAPIASHFLCEIEEAITSCSLALTQIQESGLPADCVAADKEILRGEHAHKKSRRWATKLTCVMVI